MTKIRNHAGLDGTRLVMALGLMTLAACGRGAPDDAVTNEAVGEATQAASAPICVSIQRQGAAGTVSDTGIVPRNPPKNYGGSWTISTGPIGGVEGQVLLQFDLGSIPSGPGTTILSADVNLTRSSVVPPSGPGTIEVHDVLAPWSESAVTWQSFGGAFDPAIAASFSNQLASPSFSITSLVQDWVSGAAPNNGILLKDPGPNHTTYWSSEYSVAADRPELQVCYTVPNCVSATFGGHTYAICQGSLTPSDAASWCSMNLGWQLAHIDTQAENTFVVDTALAAFGCTTFTQTSYWIGNLKSQTTPTWPGGAPVWAPGEPSGDGNNIHIMRYCGAPYGWNDAISTRQWGWVCEGP